jgi:hypothetical protein
MECWRRASFSRASWRLAAEEKGEKPKQLEPGIFIPDEGVGIRTEDIWLVTADGPELLTAGIPRIE